jgi:hypothetical protein
MKSRNFIPCNELPGLAALTTEHAKLTAMIETVHELASFSGPTGTLANSLGRDSRDTMVAELDWQLPNLRAAQTAFLEEFERFGAVGEWPQRYERTVKINTVGALALLEKSAEAIDEAETTLRKENAGVNRRIEQLLHQSRRSTFRAA